MCPGGLGPQTEVGRQALPSLQSALTQAKESGWAAGDSELVGLPSVISL